MNRSGNEAYELQEKDIEEYLNEALPELNLRLWIDMYGEEIEDRKTNVLWMESITLTSYKPHNAQRNMPVNIPHHNKWRIINRLMGKLALKLPFTLKKYKKERR